MNAFLILHSCGRLSVPCSASTWIPTRQKRVWVSSSKSPSVFLPPEVILVVLIHLLVHMYLGIGTSSTAHPSPRKAEAGGFQVPVQLGLKTRAYLKRQEKGREDLVLCFWMGHYSRHEVHWLVPGIHSDTLNLVTHLAATSQEGPAVLKLWLVWLGKHIFPLVQSILNIK